MLLEQRIKIRATAKLLFSLDLKEKSGRRVRALRTMRLRHRANHGGTRRPVSESAIPISRKPVKTLGFFLGFDGGAAGT